MKCETLQGLSVSDDLADRQALARHAAECTRCTALLAGDRRLAGAVSSWKASSPAPAPDLESRILAALATERGARVTDFPASGARAPRRRPGRWTLAAAAAVAGFALAVLLLRPAGAPPAVQEVRQAQQAYTRAIAALERQAASNLARAEDPVLPGQQALILLNYQDRLEYLDSVIAEVRSFLEDSPGNSGGHTVLLAAYKEKSELLQEIVDLRLGEAS